MAEHRIIEARNYPHDVVGKPYIALSALLAASSKRLTFNKPLATDLLLTCLCCNHYSIPGRTPASYRVSMQLRVCTVPVPTG